MRVEGEYLITDGEEAARIFVEAMQGDMFQRKETGHWHMCGAGLYSTGTSVAVRRRLVNCTTEVLARANLKPYPTEMEHF